MYRYLPSIKKQIKITVVAYPFFHIQGPQPCTLQFSNLSAVQKRTLITSLKFCWLRQQCYRDAVGDLSPQKNLACMTGLTMTFNMCCQTGPTKCRSYSMPRLFLRCRRTTGQKQHSKLHLVATIQTKVAYTLSRM